MRKYHLAGLIATLHKCARLHGRHGRQLLGRTQYIPTQRVPGKKAVFKLIIHQLRGRIAIHIYLLTYYLSFFLKLCLRKRGMRCQVAYQLHGTFMICRRVDAIQHCLLFGCVGIQFTTYTLHASTYVARFTPCCTLEDGMLYKMCQSAFVGQLIARTGIHRHTTIRHITSLPTVDYPQSIGQCCCLYLIHLFALFSFYNGRAYTFREE